VHHLSKPGLALDDAVGNVHLAAEGREPDDDLDRVNIMGDADHGRLLLLDEGGDVVDAALHEHGLLTLGGSAASGLGGTGLLEALLLLLLGLRAVLVEHLEDLGRCTGPEEVSWKTHDARRPPTATAVTVMSTQHPHQPAHRKCA